MASDRSEKWVLALLNFSVREERTVVPPRSLIPGKERTMTGKKRPEPMKEPMKPHGDKINVEKVAEKKPSGGAGEPHTSPLEPEEQGGISGP